MSVETADAIVVAAGRSLRMGPGPGKVLRLLKGRPILSYALNQLQRAPDIRRIVIVGRSEDRDRVEAIIGDYAIDKARGHWTPGGDARADSVLSGLEYLQHPNPPEWVLIQDAARPFLRAAMIRDTLRAARQTGAAVVACAVRDTIKEANSEGLLHRTLDRSRLWQIQTPQTFRFELLWQAYQQLPSGDRSRWTDDAMIVENQGTASAVVPGDPTNLKITSPDDLLRAEHLLDSDPSLLMQDEVDATES